MEDKQYVIFTRRLVTSSSLKVSARFFKQAFYFKVFFKFTDMTTIFLTSVSSIELQKLKKDQLFLIITSFVKLDYVILTFRDFLELQVEKIIFPDIFNFYFHCFQKIPESNI